MGVQLGEVLESLVCAVVVAEPARASRGIDGRGGRGRARGWLHGEKDWLFATGVCAGPGDVAAAADSGGDDLSEGIEQLLETCDLASDGTGVRSQLGRLGGSSVVFLLGEPRGESVNRCTCGEKANANASNKSSDIQHGNCNTGGLDNAPNDEDAACHKIGVSTA